jgi:uncharacterized DUF497 family protein
MSTKFDPEKDAANIVKHGLSLVEGTVGMNAGGEILVVVRTERDDGER